MVEVEDKLAEGYLKCHMIIEVIGKPKEHVEEAMRIILQKLKEEKGVDVLEGKVHKPKEQGLFFTSFVELDLLLKDMAVFTTICFDYMPSSVEIMQPEHLKLGTRKIADFVNDMLARLHDVDMRLKNVNAANKILDNNLHALLRNFVMMLIGEGKSSLENLSGKIGISSKELEPFLKKFEKEGIIKSEGSLYEKA
ncbi:hypothetical protein JXB11_04375 [Candidatus Woesearchaeota archaeon]|nr:hypothetical protein [Candidatus Woesearchaeota archaeon]